jgi:AcrR family transcriptional regulator
MSPSLREERKLRTSAAIAAAALELFAQRGYEAVTVAEVAVAARVGERTLYRYFADKEDLLFAEDADWQAALRTAIDRQPAGAAPFAVLRGASAAVTRALEERREEVRRRGEVIASAPALTARERAKHAAWEEVLAAGLRERGVAAGDARLLGRIAVACYDEALTRWLAQDGWRRTLEAEIDATFAQAAALAA